MADLELGLFELALPDVLGAGVVASAFLFHDDGVPEVQLAQALPQIGGRRF